MIIKAYPVLAEGNDGVSICEIYGEVKHVRVIKKSTKADYLMAYFEDGHVEEFNMTAHHVIYLMSDDGKTFDSFKGEWRAIEKTEQQST